MIAHEFRVILFAATIITTCVERRWSRTLAQPASLSLLRLSRITAVAPRTNIRLTDDVMRLTDQFGRCKSGRLDELIVHIGKSALRISL